MIRSEYKMITTKDLKSKIIEGLNLEDMTVDDIEDDTQTIFDVPYHSEYAHTKCFEKAVQ